MHSSSFFPQIALLIALKQGVDTDLRAETFFTKFSCFCLKNGGFDDANC
jgi:hypothetical protein